MKLFDTHTHLYLSEFSEDIDFVMSRAVEAGVENMVFPNVDLDTVSPMYALHDRFPTNTHLAMGLHPTEIKESWEEDLGKIWHEISDSNRRFVAIGEIGIDLYWDKTFVKEQIEAFSRQIDWANQLNLPIIIHSREGLNEILDVLRSKTTIPSGVFHSFGGTVEDIKAIREIGDFYFGINGIVTFKNSKLRETLPEIGLDRVVVETDAPYLAPVPFRGKRNESSYISHTANAVANALGVSIYDVAEATTHNALALFNLV